MGKLQQIIGITGSFILALISILWLVALILGVVNDFSLNAFSTKYIIGSLIALVVFGGSTAINIYHLKLSTSNSVSFKFVGLIRIAAAILGFVGSFYLFIWTFPVVLVLIISGIVLFQRHQA